MDADQLEILKKVKSGEISAEEGARRLSQLESAPPDASPQAQAAPVIHEVSPQVHEVNPKDLPEENLENFRSWWLMPLWVGLGILVFSGGFMSWAFANGLFFWFYCAWLPLSLGLLVMLLAVWSRTARWLHVRVHQSNAKESQNIRISFPIPAGLIGWSLRLVGPRIPQLKDKEWIDTAIPILETLSSSKEPLVVEVNEQDGEKVQVYIV
jgi:hypothetical protein